MAQAGLPNGIKADTARVGSVGFSLGGYTAISTAGAQISKDDYVSYCEEYAGKMNC
ncbi:MAG: hypothetical protein QNK92_09190 [Amylibacter sp.]